jgi:hypothetical protein
MPWHYRLKEWVRWVSPTTRDSDLSKQIDKISLNSSNSFRECVDKRENAGSTRELRRELGLPLNLPPLRMKTTEQTRPKTPGAAVWEEIYSNPTSIVVGHVLHEASDSHKASIKPIGKATFENTVFVPTAPKLSKLLRSWPRQDDIPEEALVIRFLPSPWTSAGLTAVREFPPVEICFSVDPDTKDPELRDAKAIVGSVVSNMMLPDRTVDLQFRQCRISQLSSSYLLNIPQITEFIRSSQLNPLNGKLKTPPGITVPIAKHLAGPHVSGPESKLFPDHMDVEYLFAGLEFRGTLNFEFEGLALLYNSIEGGKADGRRGELSLHRNSPESGVGKGADLRTSEFMRHAYRLVDALGAPETFPPL